MAYRKTAAGLFIALIIGMAGVACFLQGYSHRKDVFEIGNLFAPFFAVMGTLAIWFFLALLRVKESFLYRFGIIGCIAASLALFCLGQSYCDFELASLKRQTERVGESLRKQKAEFGKYPTALSGLEKNDLVLVFDTNLKPILSFQFGWYTYLFDVERDVWERRD